MKNNFWFEAINISCFKNGYKVIEDLNLKLKNSENVMLIGPNGSGKSSLVNLINRNIYPVVEKQMVFKIFNKEDINLWELRKKISTVNNEIKERINPNLKTFDLIYSGLYGKYCFIKNKSESDLLITVNLINQMNLEHLSQKCFSYLSDGEKQIALIARALINNPKILILDEPSANLDYKSKFYLMDQINNLSKLNVKILCITHDITTITKIYDRIIMLKNRRIIADGSQNEVINSENINRLYDIDIEVFKDKGQWNLYKKSNNYYK